MSSAATLAAFLNSQDLGELTLTIREIESIIGAALPESARKYPAYWSTGNPTGRVLIDQGWRARPGLANQKVTFSRETEIPLSPASSSLVVREPDVILIGCVKTKRPSRHRARDLYTSTLFRGRMARCLASGVPWYILSAKHGLVQPDDEIDSYDETLLNMTGPQRHEWSQRVLHQITATLGDIQGKVIEVHAGYEYRQSGLTAGLRRAGAVVTVPLEGLGIGQQLTWYADVASLGVHSPASEQEQSQLQLNRMPARVLIKTITEDFDQGRFDLSARIGAPPPGWDALPEFAATQVLRDNGASDGDVRLLITFLAAMDRARDADRLWVRGMELWSEASWAFDPLAVTARPLHELRDVLAQFGVSQRHGVDAASWRLIAEALVSDASPIAIRSAVNDGRGDAAVLLEAVRQTTPAGQPWFPLLSGPKVSVMWVRMLAAPGNAMIENLNVLPVAVDVQVRKVSEYLGLTNTTGRDLEQVRAEIQAAWSDCADAVGPEALAGTGAALDPAIWFLGKWGCSFCERAGNRRPVSRVCEQCSFAGKQSRGGRP